MEPSLSITEKEVVEHFRQKHYQDEEGRVVVPLPLKGEAIPLGESRRVAARKFKSLERSLNVKKQFGKFSECISEYFELGHAEPAPQ